MYRDITDRMYSYIVAKEGAEKIKPGYIRIAKVIDDEKSMLSFAFMPGDNTVRITSRTGIGSGTKYMDFPVDYLSDLTTMINIFLMGSIHESYEGFIVEEVKSESMA